MAKRDKHYFISIIIPFYKGETLVTNLLHSLYCAISYIPDHIVTFEIIFIVDSPETDVCLLKEKNNRVFSKLPNVSIVMMQNHVNKGVAYSRNLALSISKGDFIHIIDQDDAVNQTFYKSVLPLLDEFNFILVNGKVNYESNNYNTHLLYYLRPELNLKSLILGDFIRSPGQVVFSRQIVQGVEFPQTENYRGADDKFFWIKLFYNNPQTIKPHYLKSPLYLAKIHASNYSADNHNLQLSCLENWNLFSDKKNFGKYQSYVQRNINYLRYITSNTVSFSQVLLGFKERVIYALDLNKIIRYIVKRT
jgi:hypothetical protein